MLLLAASCGSHLSLRLGTSQFRRDLVRALLTYASSMPAHFIVGLAPQEVRRHVSSPELPHVIQAYKVALSDVLLWPIGLGILSFVLLGAIIFTASEQESEGSRWSERQKEKIDEKVGVQGSMETHQA